MLNHQAGFLTCSEPLMTGCLLPLITSLLKSGEAVLAFLCPLLDVCPSSFLYISLRVLQVL